jgi:hypothetical protein
MKQILHALLLASAVLRRSPRSMPKTSRGTIAVFT